MLNNLQIKIIQTGTLGCNTIILFSKKDLSAIIIDPGENIFEIQDNIKYLNINVKFVIHTHAHIDHIGASKKLKDILKVHFFLHIDDKELYKNIALQAFVLGKDSEKPIAIDKYFESDHEFNLDFIEKDLKLKTIHTPGHSQGSCCFLLSHPDLKPNFLFSGDTLFHESIGRCDFPGGNFESIIKSITEKLYILDKDTQVIPGHGDNTTIGYEIKNNPFTKNQSF